MIVTGPNANTSFVRNPFVKRKLAETRRYIYPLLPSPGTIFRAKYSLQESWLPSAITFDERSWNRLWLVREYSSRRSKVYTGYGFWIDSFRPFRNLRWTKIRKIRSIRVFELEDSSIFIASVWFKILYSLYAIRRHKFLRSHNRDTIGEISILDSEWANEMTK